MSTAMVAISAVLVIGVLGLVALLLGRPLIVRFGKMEAMVEGTYQAVNHQPQGSLPLYKQAEAAAQNSQLAAASIPQIEECKQTLSELRSLPEQVGQIDAKIESHLDWHRGA